MWYDKLKNKCRNCNKYLAEEITKETKNYLIWTCKFCGFKRKKIKFWAIWKMKQGKTYLKTSESKKFQECKLILNGKRPILIKL